MDDRQRRTEGSELADRLREAFRSPDYQPPTLPDVASEILRLTHDGRAGVADFTKLLERDQLIAGQVLKVANSPFYSPAAHAEVGSLERAVVRLGMNNLRNIVVEIWVRMRVFRVEGYETVMRRLANHSSATAYAALVVAKHACHDPDHVFLAGLMHDVGVAGALSVLADGDGEPPELAAIKNDLDLVHEELSGLMVGLWNLPEEIQRAVTLHHMLVHERRTDRLAAVVCVAEHLVNTLELTAIERDPYSFDIPFDSSFPASQKQAWLALDLDSDDQRIVTDEVSQTIERLNWL